MSEIVKNLNLEKGMATLSVHPKMSQKRRDYIDWETYFMSIACLVSKRSKDPVTQVGACIVNRKNRIVGHGYNGMARGCNDKLFPWGKISVDPLANKYFYVCHAEMNAIFNKNCADISDCVIYTILFPCNQCAKTIIQSGIAEVVYLGEKNINKPEAKASIKMFEASGVKFRQFVPKCGGFRINLKSFSCEEFSPPFMSREISLDLNHGQCIPWEDYFSALCILVSKRSKSPELQLGAVIVNEDHIVVSQGYNGLPFNCNDDDFPWGTGSDDALENKDLYECHAELNAILNTGVEVKGCTIYCISFPCNECAKAIIQSGIKIVVYLQRQDNRPEVLAAQRMFDAVQVVTRQHSPSIPIIHVDFNLIKF